MIPQVPGVVYVNEALQKLVFDELEQHCNAGGYGGFLPAVKQIGNVAALPGIVKYSIGPFIFPLRHTLPLTLLSGLPDTHSGYGFAIGNVAAFDMDNPESVVSPGGVGFDINCGVVSHPPSDSSLTFLRDFSEPISPRQMSVQ